MDAKMNDNRINDCHMDQKFEVFVMLVEFPKLKGIISQTVKDDFQSPNDIGLNSLEISLLKEIFDFLTYGP